jgi:hypothetical protein
MTLVNLLSLVALILIGVVLVVRMPSIVSEPSSRLAWLAALFGCAAFVCVGVVVPLDILDGWLGGTNVANLLQNVFATAAFWFIMQASRTLDGTRFDPRSLWQLPAMVVSFSIPFFLIPNRGPTSDNFIKVYADDPMLWAYASIYMSCVAYIMFRMLAGIRGRAPRQYIAIRIGAWGVATASVLEVVYLTLRVVDAQPTAFVELVGDAFVVPFYGGVIVMAIGMAGFAFVSRTRASVLVALRVLLLQANAQRGLDPSAAAAPGEDAYDTYRLAVRLTDIANSEPLNWRERAILRAATRVLDRQMSAPAVVRMSGTPQAVAP